jgi:tRNA threonylcarbamoyl adenosine modification protein (Sua5/YciO/YrdC/YwlC family)
MPRYLEVHPDNPQHRLLKQTADLLHAGGIAAVPTDSSYALVCRDLSELASYARVDNKQYRLMKLGTPGPFTFILEATKEVPRRLSHPSRRTIGLRVPDHKVLQQLLGMFGQPLLATTLIPPGKTDPLNDPEEILERFAGRLQAVVDAGACPMQPTTVIDLSGDLPVLVRQGRGDMARLGLTSLTVD